MKEFLSVIINPIPVFIILIISGFVLICFKRRKSGKIFLSIAGVWFVIFTTPPIPRYMTRLLERQYTQLSDSCIGNISAPCNILVLGGGHSNDKSLSASNKLSLIALSRLVEGIRIHRMIPGSKIVLSGFDLQSQESEASVYFNAAVSLGIDSASMMLQSTPVNTQMEAEEYAKNYNPETRLILVTSAIHMPRAVMHFRKAGIIPLPAPTDFILKYGSYKSPMKWFPSSTNLNMMESATHEIAGLLWAWI